MDGNKVNNSITIRSKSYELLYTKIPHALNHCIDSPRLATRRNSHHIRL